MELTRRVYIHFLRQYRFLSRLSTFEINASYKINRVRARKNRFVVGQQVFVGFSRSSEKFSRACETPKNSHHM